MSIVVVGGGPAGIAAAAVLARGGAEATVLEAGQYPRHRLCGEFLSPDAARALAAIGAPEAVRDAPRIGHVRVTASRASGFGTRPAELRARLEASGWGVSRLDLDARLAAAARGAGVRVLTGRRVRGIHSAAAGVVVGTEEERLAADAVIVATGRLARPDGVGETDSRRLAWVGIKTHVRGLGLPGVTELHFVDGAYVGLNEVVCAGERVVNVCALLSADFWGAAGRSPEAAWERLAGRSAPFAERWRAATPVAGSRAATARFGFDGRGAAGGGARPPLVVGDAAAMIAPLCGDGQGMALTGGVAAARILLAARAPDGTLEASQVRAAAAAWSRRFGRMSRLRLGLGRALQGALLAPRLAALVVRLAAAAQAAPRWLYRATRGPLPPSSRRRPRG